MVSSLGTANRTVCPHNRINHKSWVVGEQNDASSASAGRDVLFFCDITGAGGFRTGPTS